MGSVWERIRQRLVGDGPDHAEREAVNGQLTRQEARIAQAERVIDDYRQATQLANRAGERVIDEARRPDGR